MLNLDSCFYKMFSGNHIVIYQLYTNKHISYMPRVIYNNIYFITKSYMIDMIMYGILQYYRDKI
jgi:hypothetical protein